MIPALVEAGRDIKTVTVHKRSAPDIDKKEDLHKKLKTGRIIFLFFLLNREKSFTLVSPNFGKFKTTNNLSISGIKLLVEEKNHFLIW